MHEEMRQKTNEKKHIHKQSTKPGYKKRNPNHQFTLPGMAARKAKY